MASNGRLKVLELFAGAGGIAMGLHRAGFQHLGLFENDLNAVSTLQANAAGIGIQPDFPIRPVDVRRVAYQDIGCDIAALAAGAPCQPFSLAGNHLGLEDDRNLFPEVFRAQRELIPRAVFLENVWGLARPSFRPYLEYLLLQVALPCRKPRRHESWHEHKLRLEKGARRLRPGDEPTYDVQIAAIECANFGVPQRRNRLFIIALRTDLDSAWQWPVATHSESALLYAKHSTRCYWREHGLRARRDPILARQVHLFSPDGAARWQTVRDVLRYLPPPSRGEGLHHPNHYWIDGCRSYRGHTGSSMDEPAKTLKAGVHGVPGGENMVRLSKDSLRYFSLHESALLQTFPPAYIFRGPRSAVVRQIGNAAPPMIVHLLGAQLRRLVSGRLRTAGSQYRAPHVDLLGGSTLRQL